MGFFKKKITQHYCLFGRRLETCAMIFCCKNQKNIMSSYANYMNFKGTVYVNRYKTPPAYIYITFYIPCIQN